MITDKDREDAVSMTRIWIRDSEGNQLEELAGIISRIRRESADQARKEAAENGIIFMQERLVPGVFTDIMLDEMRAAILGETVKEGKTDAEKLAIAVKALENISGRGMTGGGIAKRALKEIQ